MSPYKAVLDKCGMSEEEFINGGIAIFDVGAGFDSIKIVAIYECGNVLIEATTYQSLIEYRRGMQRGEIVGLAPMVVSPAELEPMLQKIAAEHLTTRLMRDDDSERSIQFQIRRYEQEVKRSEMLL